MLWEQPGKDANEEVGTVEKDLSVSSSCSDGAERKGDSAYKLQETVVENIPNLLPQNQTTNSRSLVNLKQLSPKSSDSEIQ